MNKNVEILAPAGSFESLKAAVCAGADAVYMGGSRFGARAYADNPEEAVLLQAIDYVHMHGRKIYLTVNTLLKDAEMAQLYDYLLPYYKQGIDGVIVQDLGVLKHISACFPQLAIHASTQMTVTSSLGARFLKQYGVERIVPARELGIAEIRRMKEETGMEMECFIHGALCYCYSGQCLLSSLLGGRSGNRGQCAQPCRLPFGVDGGKEETVLSLKDLCTIELLPELIDAGIDSLKIEGRMKQPDYVYTVVEIYRRYADLYLDGNKEAYKVRNEDKEKLAGAYQRRGYCDGYYKMHNGRQMISFARPQSVESKEPDNRNYQIQEIINGNLILSAGNRAKLTVSCGNDIVSSEGAVAEPAQKQPLTAQRIEQQMRKTGNTPFTFETLAITMTEDIFLPMQGLNELRRNALERLSEKRLEVFRRKEPEKRTFLMPKEAQTSVFVLSALVSEFSQLKAAAAKEEITVIYLECSRTLLQHPQLTQQVAQVQAQGRRVFLSLPHIIRQTFTKELTLFDGILVRNLESLQWLKDIGYQKEIRSDYTLYYFNRMAGAFLKAAGITSVTASLELNSRELHTLCVSDAALAVYGYIPVMVTANCIKKTTGACDRIEEVHNLTDRYQKKFRVQNNCEYCYNIIYNSLPLVLLNQKKEILKLNPKELRLYFTSESKADTAELLELYTDVFLFDKDRQMPFTDFTKGHFKRGVK